MKYALILLVFIGTAGILRAQAPVVFAERGAEALALPSALGAHAATGAGTRIVQPPAGLVAMLGSGGMIQMPTPAGNLTLTLKPFDVFTSEGVVVAASSSGDVAVPIPRHVMLQGSIAGVPGSSVFMAVFETHCSGTIRFPEQDGMRTIVIAPDTIIAGRMAAHVVARQDERLGEARECHAEDMPDYTRRADSIINRIRTYAAAYRFDSVQTWSTYVLSLAVDCSYSFYERKKSNLSDAVTYAMTVVGEASAVYERDARIVLQLSFLRVWTTADPFGTDIGTAHSKFRDHWENTMRHVRRSAALLMSATLSGGLSSVGSLCSSSAYAVTGVYGTAAFPAKGYVWDVDVVAHELGHSIGAAHTQSCTWAPPVDSCWYSEGGCYDYLHARRGTIMSYCHLQPFGTELAFHPRVAWLFRGAAATSWCMYPQYNPADTDIAVVHVQTPSAGGTVQAGALFRPTAIVKNVGNKPMTNVTAWATATDRSNKKIASGQALIPVLAPGMTTTVVFDPMMMSSAGDYLMRVEAYAPREWSIYSTYNNSITVPFRVGPNSSMVVVERPNGGEKFTSGDTMKVRVDRDATTLLHIELTTDNGASWKMLVHEQQASVGDVKVVVPSVKSELCRIRAMDIADASMQDQSDNVFAIGIGHDVAIADIVAPVSGGAVPAPLRPRVVVKNNGTFGETFGLRCRIGWVAGSQVVWDTTITNRTLGAGELDTIDVGLAPYLSDGAHVLDVWLLSTTDADKSNNAVSRVFTARGQSPPVHSAAYSGAGYALLNWDTDTISADRTIEIGRRIPGETTHVIATLPPTVDTWVDATAGNDVTYIYEMRTRSAQAVSAWSAPRAVAPHTVTAHRPIVGVPKLVSPERSARNVLQPMNFVWTPVENADMYEVQIADDASMDAVRHVHIVKTLDQLVQHMPFGATYYWRVRAINHRGVGAWSETGVFGTVERCAGNAVRFDGASVSASNPKWTWPGGGVTIEWWQYVRSEDVRPAVAFMVGTKDNSQNRFMAHVPWDGNTVMWDYGAVDYLGGRVTASYAGCTDKWTHVALVSDGFSYREIYLDGKRVARTQDTRNGADNLTGLTIGSMGASLYHKAIMDEFRIWGVARTPEQIRATMYRRMPTSEESLELLGCWRFEEGKGTLVADNSGLRRDLVLSNDSGWVASDAPIMCEEPVLLQNGDGTPAPGKNDVLAPAAAYPLAWQAVHDAQWYDLEITSPQYPNWAITRSGLTDTTFVAEGIPADAKINWRVRARSARGDGGWVPAMFQTAPACDASVMSFAGDSCIQVPAFFFDGHGTTIEFWILVPDTGSGITKNSAFALGTDDVRNRFHALIPGDGGALYWDFGNVLDNGRMKTSFAPLANKWKHVAMTSNGVDSMSIYLDGVFAAASSFADTPEKLTGLNIGGNPFTRLYLRGYMADLRIWSVVRTPQQIRESRFRRITAPEHALAGSWLMDNSGDGQLFDLAGGNAPAAYQHAASIVQSPRGVLQRMPVIMGSRMVKHQEQVQYTVDMAGAYTSTWNVQGGRLMENLGTRALVMFAEGTEHGRLTYVRAYPGGCSDSVSIDIQVRDDATDVAEQASQPQGLWLSPNPASDLCRVRWAQAMAIQAVSVWTVDGQRVATLAVDASSSSATVPLSGLPNGMYIVRAEGAFTSAAALLVVGSDAGNR